MPYARPSAVASLLIGALTSALLAGCGTRAAQRGVPEPALTDTLWYISARARDARGRDSRRLADSLEFGMVVSRIRSNGNILNDALDVEHVDSLRLSPSAFAKALRERAHASPAGDSLTFLVVHGFGTSLHEAWSYALEARIRSRSAAPWVSFSWPSNGLGVAWPQPGEVFTRAYREDSAAAAASRPAFGEATRLLISTLGSARLVLVAHSLGAQLVANALADDSRLRATLAGARLRALAFVAPDLDARHFTRLLLPAIHPLARRLVVYGSSNDRMLQLSRAISNTDRVGLIGEGTESFTGIETVDTTEGAFAESTTQRVVGTHHALKRASGALFDLHIVAGGYSPDCRTTVGTGTLQARGVWKLSAVPPPPLSALSACARETR